MTNCPILTIMLENCYSCMGPDNTHACLSKYIIISMVGNCITDCALIFDYNRGYGENNGVFLPL